MRVLVCGGRAYGDRHRLYDVLDRLHSQEPFSILIEGNAQGADRAARLWAQTKRIPVITFKPDWRRHGRSAGPLRNQRMIAEGRPDLVVAFPGGRGTADMSNRARREGIRLIEITDVEQST